MTAVESVQFTARCDGGCGGDARWSGVPAAVGGGTTYRIFCLGGCGTIDPESGIDNSGGALVTVEPCRRPPVINRIHQAIERVTR